MCVRLVVYKNEMQVLNWPLYREYKEDALVNCLLWTLRCVGPQFTLKLSAVPRLETMSFCTKLSSSCNINQLNALFILTFFVKQLLHVSGMFVVHHQEVCCIYIYIYIYSDWYVLCFSVDCLLAGV